MAAFSMKGTRLGGIIAISCLILGLIFFGIVMIANSNLAEKEIHKIIESQGGKVLSIYKVNLEESPFLDTMESRIGKRNQYSWTVKSSR